jgi:hypothetical protein
MIKIFVSLLFIFTGNLCFAQYYTVNDNDGFVNVRSMPDINAAIICPLPNETIVLVPECGDSSAKSNWLEVNFYVDQKGNKKDHENYTPAIMKGFTLRHGYIYKTKLTAIEKLTALQYKQQKDGYTCYNDSIKIKVGFAPFILSKHTIKYTNDGAKLFDKIDNRPMVGTDGSKPADEIKIIALSINNVPVTIPPSSYKNLFNPSFQNYAYADKKGMLYLVMYNSDAAGSYSCIFVFKKGKFIQRVVFEGEC